MARSESDKELVIKVLGDIKDIAGKLKQLDERFREFAQKSRAGVAKVDETVEHLGASMEQINKKINGHAGNLIKLGLAVQQTLYLVSTFSRTVSSMIKPIEAQEQAETALAQAMIQTGNYTRAAFEELKRYAAQLQQATTFGDEMTLQALAMLEAMTGLDAKALKPVIKATQDLAAGMKVDLFTAANMVGKAIGSETNALSRWGIQVEGAAKSVARAQSFIKSATEHFGGMAEAMARIDTGKLGQFSNTLGDIKEQLSGGVRDILMPFVSLAKIVIDWLNSTGITLRRVTRAVMPLVVALGLLGLKARYGARLLEFLSRKLLLATMRTEGLGAALKALNASLGPVGWAILALTAAYEVVLWWKNRNIEATEKEVEKQKELQSEMNRIAGSVNLGQLKAEIKTREAKIKVLREEIKLISGELNQTLTRINRAEMGIKEADDKEREALLKLKSVEGQRRDSLNKDLEIKTAALQKELKLQNAARAREQFLKSILDKTREQIEAEFKLKEIRAQGTADLKDDIKVLKERQWALLGDKRAVDELSTQDQIAYYQLQQRIDQLNKKLQEQRQAIKRTAQAHEDFRHSISYLVNVEGKSLAEARKARKAYLQERIRELQGATDKELQLKIKYQEELKKLNDEDAAWEKQYISRNQELEIRRLKLKGMTEEDILRLKIESIKSQLGAAREGSRRYLELQQQLQDAELSLEEQTAARKKQIREQLVQDLGALIRGEGYVYQDIQDRILAKASETTARMLIDAEYRERMFTQIRAKWGAVRLALEKGWEGISQALHLRRMIREKVEMAKDMASAGIKLIKSAMSLPFPVNLAASAAAVGGLIALVNSLKNKVKSIVAFAQGGVVEKATLALVGEMGPEVIAPRVTFQKYVTEQLTPLIEARLQGQVQTDLKGHLKGLQKSFEEGLNRVERAIYATRPDGRSIARELANFRRGSL